MDLFAMFGENEEIKNFEEEQKKQSEKVIDNTKKDTKNVDAKAKKAVAKPAPIKSTINTNNLVDDANKKIVDKLKEYSKVDIKVFGEYMYSIEGKEELEQLDLDSVKKKLIEEYGCEMLGEGAFEWHLISREDKAILIATYKLYAKG